MVLCSPLQRARRTCELAGLAGAAVLDPEVQEWDYGSYEGRTADEICAERPGWVIWVDGVVGGESLEDVGRRADSVIERVRQVEGDVAIFAHGHLPAHPGLPLVPAPGRWRESGWPSPRPRCRCSGTSTSNPVVWLWNDTCHLRG